MGSFCQNKSRHKKIYLHRVGSSGKASDGEWLMHLLATLFRYRAFDLLFSFVGAVSHQVVFLFTVVASFRLRSL